MALKSYFYENYFVSGKPEYWATYVRLYCRLNTNMFSESFFNSFKQSIDRKANLRLDRLLLALLSWVTRDTQKYDQMQVGVKAYELMSIQHQNSNRNCRRAQMCRKEQWENMSVYFDDGK